MGTAIKILVVEDEMIIAAKISLFVTNLGYEVTGICADGKEAAANAKLNQPDIVLLDINLKGGIDGIETASLLQKENDLAIIYITANSDEPTFNRAKVTKPAAFIAKPFRQLDLQRAIELAISRMADPIPLPLTTEINADVNLTLSTATGGTGETPFILKDRIFIRHKEKMVKVMLGDILYMEAERNYSRIFTGSKAYLLSITLKAIEEKMTMQQFMRIHRSYLINITHIDEVAEHYVVIAQKQIPLGTGMRDHVMQKIQTL